MPPIPQRELLRQITDFYLQSHDFNGLPARLLCDSLGRPWEVLRPLAVRLIQRGLAQVLTAETELNSHINRTGFPDVDRQVASLQTEELHHTCFYPSGKHLAVTVDRSEFADTPYRLLLACGEPQLGFVFFDLAILEQYRNDPRYMYECDDIGGRICVTDDYYRTSEMPDRDQVLLEAFGFAYDENLNRCVVAFIRDLAGLTPDHQRLWSSRQLDGAYDVHPDWYNSQVLGQWGSRVSIFTAFLDEQRLINQMARAMGRPPLFQREFGGASDPKPRGFSFLVRPTAEESRAFVLLLDKLLSDNIDADFFGGDLPLEREIRRHDGRVEIQRKGTLSMLDEWFRRHYSTDDWTPWEEAVKTLKEVRRERARPAHVVDDDAFDQRYVAQQRELMVRAYGAMRTLRQALERHPAVRSANITVPEWLERGQIWTC